MAWLVVVAGVAAIAWINWYFFVAERGSASASVRDDGNQEITIAINGGYSPSVIRVRAGRPVRLVFDRQETSSCSEEVVIGAFGIRRYLPPFERTSVEIPAPEAGTYDFTCGMGMLHGKLVAE
jgi:plastocyanin domain-containing protein